jgi:serine/threonine-protein kinase
LNRNTPVAVPDVRLEVKQLAVQHITERGFKPRLQEAYSPTVAKGSVISEDPGPGAKIGKGSIVTLTISTGVPKATVPDVHGQKLSDALQLLYAVGLQPKIAYVFSAEPADVVVAQAPSAKTVVQRGATVRINVSKGLKPVLIPDVTGQPFANAKSALQGQGFVVTRVDIQSSQPKGTVVSTDPPGGTSVPKGSKIAVSVSKGPGTTQVPDVTGQNESDATTILKQAGFAVGVVYQPVNDPGSDGIVISQNPIGGQQGTSGETIVITVGQLTNGNGNNGNGNGNGGGQTTTGTTTTP